MNWKTLSSQADLDFLLQASYHSPQIIFKHSTRCSTSSLAMGRLKRHPDLKLFVLDVIGNRELSNRIAADFKVWHESPQVLVIRNGVCTYDESHLSIQADELVEKIAA